MTAQKVRASISLVIMGEWFLFYGFDNFCYRKHYPMLQFARPEPHAGPLL
jgi:hypothetical protein